MVMPALYWPWATPVVTLSGVADLFGALLLKLSIEVEPVAVGLAEIAECAEGRSRYPWIGDRHRGVRRLGQVRPRLRSGRAFGMDGDQVEHGDSDIVGRPELLRHRRGLFRQPAAHQLLVPIVLHGEWIAGPHHVRLQPARADVACNPGVQFARRRPEKFDLAARMCGVELLEDRLDGRVTDAGVEGD